MPILIPVFLFPFPFPFHLFYRLPATGPAVILLFFLSFFGQLNPDHFPAVFNPRQLTNNDQLSNLVRTASSGPSSHFIMTRRVAERQSDRAAKV